MSRINDLSGKKFGHLTAKEQRGRTKTGGVKWLCVCDCGEVRILPTSALTSGNTSSCGCNKKILTSIRKKTHGMSKTVEYSTWCKMKERCYNKKIRDFKWYGAKGIIVCKRWLNSFENFLKDMGPKPTQKHSIERKNSKKNYCPSNCVWDVQKEQVRNREGVIKVIYNGVERRLIEVCEEINANPSVVRHRIRKGWDLTSALTAPKFTTYKTLRKQRLNNQ